MFMLMCAQTLEANIGRVLGQTGAIGKLIDDAGDELWHVIGSAHSVPRGKGLDGKELPPDNELASGISLYSEIRGIQRRLLNELTGAGDGDGVGRSLRKQSLHRMCDQLFELHVRALNAGRVKFCHDLKAALCRPSASLNPAASNGAISGSGGLRGSTPPAPIMTADALRVTIAVVWGQTVMEMGQRLLCDSWLVICEGLIDYARTLIVEKLHDDVFPILLAASTTTGTGTNAAATTTTTTGVGGTGFDNLSTATGIEQKLKSRLPSQLTGFVDARTFVATVIDSVVSTRVSQLMRPRLAYLEGVVFRQSNTELIQQKKTALKKAVGSHLQAVGYSSQSNAEERSTNSFVPILGSGH